MELRPEPLTRAAFAQFGDVIQVSEENQKFSINHGLTECHHNLATPDVNAEGGWPMISIFRSQAVDFPFPIKVMERHPLGSQAFMPLSGNPYLVVVAPAGDFRLTELRSFIAQSGQGVNYHRGTWHHYCMALHGCSDFLVVDRGGQGSNCDEFPIADDPPVVIAPE
ncbi:MAG: ureidoglycolate lyase [Gammaproteobacteria bacterium]|nr:ureidoglycolate lyase [Gammaproteobacteria bacterium]